LSQIGSSCYFGTCFTLGMKNEKKKTQFKQIGSLVIFCKTSKLYRVVG